MKPILKAASDICEVPVALVYMQKDTDIKIVVSLGDCDEPVVSAVKKISGMLDPNNGLSIIKNVREHEEAASRLSNLEMDKTQFFAGATLKNETGNNIGAFWLVFDESNGKGSASNLK